MSEKSIYKYELTMGENKLKLPKGAIILSAKEQFNKIVLYLAVDPDYNNPKTEVRHFHCFMTGTTICDYEDIFVFIDTVLLNSGAYVAHVCEKIK